MTTPAGAKFLEDKYDANGIVGANPDGHCSTDKKQNGITLPAGTWTVNFTGTANGYLVGELDIARSS